MISKSIHRKFSTTILFTVFVLMMCLTVPVFSDTDDSYCIGESDGIFEYAVESDVAMYPNAGESFTNPAVLRSRFVKVKFDRVKEAFQKKGAASQHLRFNLFEDVAINARLERLEHHKSGSTSWIGKGVGKENSSVIFTVLDNVMIGSFTIGSKSYAIRYVGGEFHEIQELDPSKHPDSLEPEIENDLDLADVIGQEQEDGENQVREVANTYIDVMVVYTATTRIAAGGSTAIKATINQAITETNVGFINSQVYIRLRLAYTKEVSYSESGFSWSACLNRLVANGDGHMDEIHSLRDIYAADIVTMIVENQSSCGMAKAIMANASTAFCLVSRGCATSPEFSFAQEIGHLHGARHDRYSDNTDYYFYYNHGYIYPLGYWRTIMGTNAGCLAQGVNCSVINFWSNPNLTYGGVPLGVPGGAGIGADNHRCLNETAPIVAAFRQPIPEDLYVEGCTVSPSIAMPGETINMSCTVKGFGKSYSYLKYYLSEDSTWDAGDTYISSDYVDSGHVDGPESASYTLPDDMAPGVYYIIFKADANGQISETDEANNICYASFRVAVPLPKADLLVTFPIVVGTTSLYVERGEYANAMFNVRNWGDGAAPGSTLELYYSTDSTLNKNSDQLLGTVQIEALQPGTGTARLSFQFRVSSVAPDSFYIFFVADANDVVSEENEDNNVIYYKVDVEN